MSASWADVADSEKAASRAKPAYVPTHLRNMQSEPVATLPQNDRPGYGLLEVELVEAVATGIM